jgi:hypothetical protein
MIATGGSPSIDAAEVRRALAVLLDSRGCHELTALPSGESRMVRASDLDAAIRAATALSDGSGLYFSLNPVRPGLGDHTAKVGDIVARRWLLVDCDRPKVKGDPSADAMATDAERASASALAGKVVDWLLDQGWPLPIMIDSGNGQHLLYRVDLPANDRSRVAIAGCLKALVTRWDAEQATIDTKMANANRISKLPGTWVRKQANTAERPWRIARLSFVPNPCEVVSIEQIEAVAGIRAEPADPPITSPWVKIVPAEPDRITAYIRSALEKEIVKLVLAPEGSRNNMLNEAAFSLGQFVGAYLMDRADITRQLTEAARRCGLGDDEITKTIESGMDAGVAQPRVLPQSVLGSPSRNGQQQPIDPNKRLVILASEVTPRRVEWLVPGLIPLGKLTTFAGWGGLGKSFVTMDLAARLSRGDEIPGLKGECFDAASVLIVNTEDDPDDTTVPRLIEAGADLGRIGFARPDVLGRFTLADLKILEAMLRQLGDVRLVVIDPASAHLGNASEHKNAELRALLSPLALWAMTRRVAVILITHITKPQVGRVEAMARVMGSVAWVNAVRAAVMFARDPEDKSKRLFLPFKLNNAPERKGLRYQIEPTDSLARVKWLDEVEITADEALNAEKPTRREIVASEWLIDRFREKLRWFSDDLFALAKQEGISRNAMFEAKKSLGLPTCDQEVIPGGKKAFVWWVPSNWAPLKRERDGGTVGQCESNSIQDKDNGTVPDSSDVRDTAPAPGTVPTVPVSQCPTVPLSRGCGDGPGHDPILDILPDGWMYFKDGRRVQ